MEFSAVTNRRYSAGPVAAGDARHQNLVSFVLTQGECWRKRSLIDDYFPRPRI
jgi:hypothetical protein